MPDVRPVVALVPGPQEHGVTRHARSLAAAGGLRTVEHADRIPVGAVVDLDFTDRLFGADLEASAAEVERLLDRLTAHGCRLVVTLHDVPPGPVDPLQARRSALYRAVAERADVVAVASRHERTRLARCGVDPGPVQVVPLPVPASTGSLDVRPPESVTVLGFLYPGKGHAEVLHAMRDLPAEIPLVCVGRPADGHDDLARELTRGGRPVVITGFVPDAQLGAYLQAATVPVVANRNVSASGSLATWWQYRRRPLMAGGDYARELATAHPGCVHLYEDLHPALTAAWADPGDGWLPVDAEPGPTLAEVAALRARWL